MMRGASLEAVSALADQVASVPTLGDAETLGDELFTLATLVRSDPALRRVVTDASLPAEVKQGVVRDLFAGKVGDRALGLLADAVGRRWVAQRDLADALEHLSVVAVVRSAGAKAGQLADELFAYAQVVKSNPELRDTLSDPSRTAEDKAGLVQTLLGGRALPATLTLAKQSLAGTYRTVAAALEEYQKVAADVHGQGVATVRSARPLGDDDLQRLTDALARQYARPVHVNLLVEPELVGGVRIEIGNDVIDGTVASRLDEARRRLVG